MTTNQKLRELMQVHGLTRSKAAELLKVTHSCIDNWLNPVASKNYRNMSYPMYELLLLKLDKINKESNK